MRITDEVSDIIFRNDDNGYSVIRLRNSGHTAVGFFAIIGVGQELHMQGDYVSNAKFGDQFKVSSYEIVPPNSPSKIKQFLSSGLIEGVGPATAERIVKEFGKDTLRILEQEPHKLSKIRGISASKATVIGERYAGVKDMQAAIVFLQGFDVSLNMALKIYKQYGANTIKIVQSNPYRLIEKIDGVGFLTADKMAKELGHNYAGVFRVRAGVIYVLRQSSEQDGHTFLPKQKLLVDICRLLKIKMSDLEPVMDSVLGELCIDKHLTAVKVTGAVGESGKHDQSSESDSSNLGEESAESGSSGTNGAAENDAQGYMLTKYYVAEKSIATRLFVLSHGEDGEESPVAETSLPDDFSKMLSHYENINKIKLHDMQINAVRIATTKGVCVITGGPGTGKTTIVKAILHMNKASGLSTKLLAPTGRAAKRMEDATEYSASTIHRALHMDGGGVEIMGYEDEAIEEDVIIIDEFSMCDVLLVSQLLRRVLPATRLVFVGDVDQLASVGAGSVLADLINSGVLPVASLSEIYRQSEASQIVVASHAINKGIVPDLTNKSSDFFFVPAGEVYDNSGSYVKGVATDIKEKVVSLVSSRIPKFLKTDSSRIQVLCPMKAGEAGMESLNRALQEELNPQSLGKSEYEFGSSSGLKTVYRVGDRVMQTKNNYQQEWARGREDGEGVFNGDIGVILSVNRSNGEVEVEFEDGRVAIYKKGDLGALVLSYAITVHKSQGCEFDVVIIPVTSGAYMILTRNLLYTAVTRAKKMVVLVGDPVNIEKMVKNTYTNKRHTMLGSMLRNQAQRLEWFGGK